MAGRQGTGGAKPGSDFVFCPILSMRTAQDFFSQTNASRDPTIS